uniref:DUF3373 domain-containing protein n=1 Tax=Sulfurihydrogenibium sp. TaxID=2053621 RepID=UPI0026134823
MKKVVLSTAIFSSFTLVAQADENRIKALEEQIKILQQEIQELKQSSKKTEELSKETEIIKEEIRNLKLEVAIPELELKSFYGLGPAASKAYFNPKGLSIGGYGELTFVHNDVNARGGAKNIADVERFILYIGYSFSEKIKFNSELELEHASTFGSHGTGGGYFKAEFAALDFLLNEKFNIRSGLVLMPVGIINEVHEPPTFPSAQRPFFERRILMSTWEEMGIGAYGKVGPLEYKAYLINGLMLKGGGDYSSVEPLKNVRQRGARAVADRFGFTGRVDYNLPNNLKIGASLVHADIQSKGGS